MLRRGEDRTPKASAERGYAVSDFLLRFSESWGWIATDVPAHDAASTGDVRQTAKEASKPSQ